jgi:hypothetical protein
MIDTPKPKSHPERSPAAWIDPFELPPRGEDHDEEAGLDGDRSQPRTAIPERRGHEDSQPRQRRPHG